MPALAPAPAVTGSPDPAPPAPVGAARTERLTTNEPTVRAILRDSAPVAVERPPARAAWLCGTAAAGLLWACFDPVGWGPLAWAALVPLCLLVRSPVRARWEVRALWLCGFVGTACQIQWMRLGDAAMYPAWLALSLYLGLYFPAFVLAARGLVHRARVPFAVAIPVVWCGLELIRGRLMTGFGWNLLAHSQWDWTTLIQVADLGGAYLVSAVVALGNAALALLVPAAALAQLGLAPGNDTNDKVRSPRFDPKWPAVGTVAVLAGVLLYGVVRRGGAPFPAGPRVALVQTDHPSGLHGDPGLRDGRFHECRLLSAAATPYRPDLVVWPESAFPYPVCEVEGEVSDEEIAALANPIPVGYVRNDIGAAAMASLAETAGAYLLTGVGGLQFADPDGPGPRPAALTRYGSAAMAAPTGGVGPDGLARGALAGRYDKRHRVVFGEYIPDLPGLASLTPFTETPGRAFGIGAGAEPVAFMIRSVGAEPDGEGARPNFSVAPLICYEDTVPHLVRDTVNALPNNGAGEPRGPDLLAVLSNDGWFDESAEQQQHLAVSLFRAVETRTPLVRASNTGVSAVIDGDGVPREPDVYLNGAGKRTEGPALPDETACVLIADVPLDPRRSLYLMCGDWLAFLCAAAACGGFVLNLRRRPATV